LQPQSHNTQPPSPIKSAKHKQHSKLIFATHATQAAPSVPVQAAVQAATSTLHFTADIHPHLQSLSFSVQTGKIKSKNKRSFIFLICFVIPEGTKNKSFLK
jgi:hypothetical protein